MTSSRDKTLINGLVNIWQWLVALGAAFFVPAFPAAPCSWPRLSV